KRGGMLKEDGNDPRKLGPVPLLVKIVSAYPVRNPVLREHLVKTRGQFALLGLIAERRPQVEVVLNVNHGIVHIGVSFVAFGQKYGGADIEWMSPEIAQQLALNFDVLQLGRVLRQFNGRHLLCQAQLQIEAAIRVQMDSLDVAV